MLFPPLFTEEMLSERQFIIQENVLLDIRFATEEDLEAIMVIQKACYDGEAPWGRIAVGHELRNKKTSFFLICQDQALPIAFIGLSLGRERIHLTNIATVPAYQKQGIASFLIEQAAEIGRQIGSKAMTLEVRMSNEPAKRLYRKIGFADGQIKYNYYHNNGEDALDMIYKLEKLDDCENVPSTK